MKDPSDAPLEAILQLTRESSRLLAEGFDEYCAITVPFCCFDGLWDGFIEGEVTPASRMALAHRLILEETEAP